MWKIIITLILTPVLACSAGVRAKSSAFDDVRSGNLTNLKKSVSSKNINNKNKEGRTLVMLAAASGQTEILSYLITEKADLNEKDSEGNTALFFALANEYSEVAKKIIENNADLFSINEVKESALIVAISYNNIDMIKMILAKQPSLLNFKDENGVTPIMVAASSGSDDTIKVLVSAGADLRTRDILGRTAYDIGKKNQMSPKSLSILKPKK